MGNVCRPWAMVTDAGEYLVEWANEFGRRTAVTVETVEELPAAMAEAGYDGPPVPVVRDERDYVAIVSALELREPPAAYIPTSDLDIIRGMLAALAKCDICGTRPITRHGRRVEPQYKLTIEALVCDECECIDPKDHACAPVLRAAAQRVAVADARMAFFAECKRLREEALSL